MTENEAIKDIKENILPSAGGKSLVLAISALEKQIPKKPIVNSSKYGFIDAYYCPVCNSYIRSIATRREVILTENIFCGVCGQKINWESDEE